MWASQSYARSPVTVASYPVLVHRLASLLRASFGPRLATSGYFHPCALLSLLLYRDVKGTCTPKLSNMLGTHRHRGKTRLPPPATTPYMRVRIRRFGGLS